MNYTIKNADIEIYNDSESFSFPKYTSQLINWANQNAQGTRPKVVGQMSELFPEFLESDEEKTIEGWRKWYTERYPDAFQNATDKIWEQVVNLNIFQIKTLLWQRKPNKRQINCGLSN